MESKVPRLTDALTVNRDGQRSRGEEDCEIPSHASFKGEERAGERGVEILGNAGSNVLWNETSKRMTKSFGMTRLTAITRLRDRCEIPTEDLADPPPSITNANL